MESKQTEKVMYVYVIPRATTKNKQRGMLGKFKRGTKNVQRNQKCLKKTIRGKTWKKQIENNNRLNLSILIVTLNLNSLNTPIKKHR